MGDAAERNQSIFPSIRYDTLFNVEFTLSLASARHDQHHHSELAVLSVLEFCWYSVKISTLGIVYSVSFDELACCAAFNHLYLLCFSVFSW